MCDMGHAGGDEGRALCYFRFFVYREYREIRHLGDREKGRYDKFADRLDDLYELRRTEFAKLWHQVRSETVPPLVRRPFEEKIGLRLQDLEEAFRWGKWYDFENPQKVYGGPKHADIALHTRHLGDAIEAGRWTDLVPHELTVLRNIEHNRPRPARKDYESLLKDLAELKLPLPSDCCLVDAD